MCSDMEVKVGGFTGYLRPIPLMDTSSTQQLNHTDKRCRVSLRLSKGFLAFQEESTVPFKKGLETTPATVLATRTEQLALSAVSAHIQVLLIIWH